MSQKWGVILPPTSVRCGGERQALAPPLRGAPTSRPGLPTASRRGPARQPALAITGKAGGLSVWTRRQTTSYLLEGKDPQYLIVRILIIKKTQT